MFHYDSIEKHLSDNHQNILNQLEIEWPKLAKEYILNIDKRINEQVEAENHPHVINNDIQNSNLAPDLQRRLILRYSTFLFVNLQFIYSQNSQNTRTLTIEEEIQIYENEMGTPFLACTLILFLNHCNLIYNNLYSGKSRQENLETASIVDFYDEQKAKLPRLHKIVKLLCCVPCSSMPIESLFSIISNKLTRKTNRLSDETLLNQLVTSFFYQFQTSVDQIL